MAECQCQCGQELPAGTRTKYLSMDHRNADRSRLMAEWRAAKEGSTSVDIESFSATLLEIKASKGYSWRQMSHLTGRSMSHISGLALGRGQKKRIRSETAEDILRRLRGEHLPPTKWQVKAYNEKLAKVQREQRAETIKNKKAEERNAKLAKLSLRLGSSEDQPAQNEQA